MPVPENDDTATVLSGAWQNVFGQPGDLRSCTPLRGGTDNRTYLITVQDAEVVAKLPDRGTGSILDPATQFAILKRVAAIGLGPAALGVDRDSGVLFTEYRSAALPWSAERAKVKINIGRIAEALRALHGLAMDLRPFEPMRFADHYIDEMDSKQRRAVGPLADELRALSTQCPDADRAAVLCHNDLVAENVLDDGRLWLIDFEYAVSAPPTVDLASLAAMNEYDPSETNRLLDAYHGRGARPYERRAFAKVVRVQQLIAEIWRTTRRLPRG